MYDLDPNLIEESEMSCYDDVSGIDELDPNLLDEGLRIHRADGSVVERKGKSTLYDPVLDDPNYRPSEDPKRKHKFSDGMDGKHAERPRRRSGLW